MTKGKASYRCVTCATCALHFKMAPFHTLCHADFTCFSSIIISRTIIQITNTSKDRTRHKKYAIPSYRSPERITHISMFTHPFSVYKKTPDILQQAIFAYVRNPSIAGQHAHYFPLFL